MLAFWKGNEFMTVLPIQFENADLENINNYPPF